MCDYKINNNHTFVFAIKSYIGKNERHHKVTEFVYTREK